MKLHWIAIALALFSMAGNYYVHRTTQEELSVRPPVVVFDVDRRTLEKLRADPNLSPEDALAQTRAELKRLGEQGFLVINREGVYASPAELEVGK